VKLLIDKGADVNALISNGTNAIHLAADLGHVECLEALLEAPSADPNIRICIREKESTALHLAADEGNIQCVSLLLEKGADAKMKNHRGFTALHLAARVSSLECVELILQMSDADPNSEDFDQRTALHAALGKSEQSIDIIEMLVACKADVNHKDIFGYTPVHLAGLEGLTQCVEALIYFGADVTSKSKRGTTALSVIKRKTPSALTMINRKLDAACVLHQVHENFNNEIELELNFTGILEFCHPKEISYLNIFIDEGDKELLEHPICSAFLYIKWIKIRKYYLARLMFCFLYVLFFTLYVLTALAHNCYNINNTYNKTVNIPNELDELNGTRYGDENVEICQEQSILGDMLRDNPFVINMQWMVLAGLTVIEIIRKGFGITG
jgi:ankyrin repeat protein